MGDGPAIDGSGPVRSTAGLVSATGMGDGPAVDGSGPVPSTAGLVSATAKGRDWGRPRRRRLRACAVDGGACVCDRKRLGWGPVRSIDALVCATGKRRDGARPRRRRLKACAVDGGACVCDPKRSGWAGAPPSTAQGLRGRRRGLCLRPEVVGMGGGPAVYGPGPARSTAGLVSATGKGRDGGAAPSSTAQQLCNRRRGLCLRPEKGGMGGRGRRGLCLRPGWGRGRGGGCGATEGSGRPRRAWRQATGGLRERRYR